MSESCTDFIDDEGDEQLKDVSDVSDVSDTSFNALLTDMTSYSMVESSISWLIIQLLPFEAIKENTHVLLNEVRIIFTVEFLLYPPFW